VLRNEAAKRPPASPEAALEEFAKDLRDLRSKAGLGYPEMAELSHYTMKTLASAAGGIKLPTLPVTTAYVRACGGNVAEWEDRWHQVAALIEPSGDPGPPPEPGHAEADRGADDAQGPGQAEGPGDGPRRGTPEPESPPEQVYVITSAAPKRPYQ
jgi:hypothetical protein